MDELVRNALKQRLGMTEEQLDRMSPGIQKVLSPKLLAYKIVAEVTESVLCPGGFEVGQRLVVGPGTNVNVEETTCPLCIGVLGPMMERVHLIWDRILEGVDPNEGWLRHLVCYDPGLERGGLGTVAFKVYAEKAG
ncbi:MAG TPA: hypothetical protein VNA25_25865 [Phycisphaerae bacterium]|nr:hypothetical protein [Phycisphaerae bacterium]